MTKTIYRPTTAWLLAVAAMSIACDGRGQVVEVTQTRSDHGPPFCFTVGTTESEIGELTKVVRDYLGDDLIEAETGDGRRAHIAIQQADLDGDNVNELIARIVHFGYCGTAGCTVLILKRGPGAGPTVLLDGLTEYIEVAESVTNGMCDIRVLGPKRGRSTTLRWSGTTYESPYDAPPEREHRQE